ncbi:hypothetical protein WN55_10946 [Dufourea novaeangliae]|uniref:Uncharacterized protein n=1 Tax=Dufourea novaeangliae TaxID=178035 RepID=A0A154P8N3_DUFNO|nr:hypothetical protein WN55_10946 [Dufourea novaeangliae]
MCLRELYRRIFFHRDNACLDSFRKTRAALREFLITFRPKYGNTVFADKCIVPFEKNRGDLVIFETAPFLEKTHTT